MKQRKTFFVTLTSAILILLFFALLILFIVLSVQQKLKWTYWLIIILITYLINITTSFYLLNNKRRITNVKLSWIFVINLLPITGFFAFFIFGLLPFKIENANQIKLANISYNENENYSFTNKFIADKKNKKYTDFFFVFNYLNTPIYEQNKIKIIDQSDLFKASITLIRAAKKFIHIQFYIISDCYWFYILINELIKKSKEGIKIRFMYDWVGSHKRFNKKNITYLKENGIEVFEFNPQGFTRYTSITNFRNHRKLILIDNKYCITGGSNIGSEYINLKKGYDNWKDLNYFIEGEIVNSINLRFCNDWINYTKYKKQQDVDLTFYKNNEIFKSENKLVCQAIHSSPEFDLYVYQQILMSKITSATKKIWIATPYFLIPDEIANNLIYAAVRGVDVRLLLPHYPDNKRYILISNRANYEKLIAANIKVYEYYGFMHSKAIIIDDDQCLLGSSNLDFRSLLINYETILNIISVDFNTSLQKVFVADFKNSRLISPEYIKKKLTLIYRLFSWIITIIQPLL